MLTATISDFRKNIKDYLNKVTDEFETLIINRGKDSGIVVLSLEEYNLLKKRASNSNFILNDSQVEYAAKEIVEDDRFQRKIFEKGIEKLSKGKANFKFLEGENDWWDNLSEEHKNGIQRGIEDIKAGRTV